MNKNSFVTLFAVILMLTLLCPLLVSCTPSASLAESSKAETTAPEATQDENKEPEETGEKDKTIIRYSGDPDHLVWAQAYLNALPDRDFGGATVIITSPDTTMLDPAEVSFLSEVLKARNAAVEEKYNVKLVFSKQTTKDMLEESTKALEADMYYTDIMCLPLAKIDNFSDEDILMNLSHLPFLDESQPYFNASSVNALSAGYEFFGISGEALPATDLPVVIFNSKIAAELGIDDIYDVALDGKLTWSKLFEYASLCKDSKKHAGIVFEGGASYESVYFSLDNKLISSGAGRVPTVKASTDSISTTLYCLNKINAMSSKLDITTDTARRAFNDGKALFIIGTVGELDEYRNSKVPIGVLPMPKANEKASYRSVVSGEELVMCVPANSKNPEMASLILSALNAASYGYITESAATYLHATTLPDNESAEVLEMISRTAVYDLSVAFASSIPFIGELREALLGALVKNPEADLDNAAYTADIALSARFKLQN